LDGYGLVKRLDDSYRMNPKLTIREFA